MNMMPIEKTMNLTWWRERLGWCREARMRMQQAEVSLLTGWIIQGGSLFRDWELWKIMRTCCAQKCWKAQPISCCLKLQSWNSHSLPRSLIGLSMDACTVAAYVDSKSQHALVFTSRCSKHGRVFTSFVKHNNNKAIILPMLISFFIEAAHTSFLIVQRSWFLPKKHNPSNQFF